MRTTSVRIASLLLLTAFLLLPATALAAPAITITPAAVPRGGEVTVTGSGFAPGAALSAVLDVGNGRQVPVTDVTAAADGTIRFTFKIPTSAPPGETVALLIVARPDGAVLARGTLTVTAAPPVAGEQVSIAPPAGPAGTRFVGTGTGFTPGETLRLGVAPTATGAQTPPARQVDLGTLRVGADGRFTVTIDSTGYPPEGYDLAVFTGMPGPPTIARFTVTAGAAPGLPNTGGGGSDPAASASGTLLPLLALVGLVALAVLGQRRYRRRRA